ncbi:hypothetical protein B296_00030870, partial [Ensete ventricosum]
PPNTPAPTVPRPVPSDVGRVLGRPMEDVRATYTFGRELGRGQFGVTYLVVHRETRKQLACKAIATRKLVRQDDLDDVRREIQIMHHLTGHRNIVELKGAYEDRQSVNLVMELCEGGELFDRIIAKGHYSERAAAALCREIVSVVHACHSMGVMHRDLKPENFLLLNRRENSPLKATDFGLSVFFKPGKLITFLPSLDLLMSLQVPISFATAFKVTVNKIVALQFPKYEAMIGKVIAESLSEDEIMGLKEMFKLIDTDNSGTITFEELKAGLPKLGNLGIKISESEVRQLMEADVGKEIRSWQTILAKFRKKNLHFRGDRKSDVLSDQIDVPPGSGQGGGIRITPGVEVSMFGFKDADPKRISIIEDMQNAVGADGSFNSE